MVIDFDDRQTADIAIRGLMLLLHSWLKQLFQTASRLFVPMLFVTMISILAKIGARAVWEWHLRWPLPNMTGLGFPPQRGRRVGSRSYEPSAILDKR